MSPARASLAGMGGVGVLLVALIGLTLLGVCGGCGKSALDNATGTLEAFEEAQAAAVTSVGAGLEADLTTNCQDLPLERVEEGGHSPMEQCAWSRAEAFRRAEGGLNASAETLDALALALLTWAKRVTADEASEDDPPVPVCEALSSLVAVAESWAEFAGASLPIAPWTCGSVS